MGMFFRVSPPFPGNLEAEHLPHAFSSDNRPCRLRDRENRPRAFEKRSTDIRYEQLLPQHGELSTFEYRYNVILSASRAEKFANARNGKRVWKERARNRADMKKRVLRI